MIVATLLAAAGLAACGDNATRADVDAPLADAARATADARPDAATPPDAFPAPATLADTGLCADATCATISADVHLFQPRWTLWADAASKRRWIYLPPGTTIDTSDMNVWRFPQGTKLWKEFSAGATRLETRMYWKYGPGDADWYQVAFAWNAAQDAATAQPTGDQNVLGTQHDIPSRGECRMCHDRVAGRVLGFSALSLDWTAPAGSLDLAQVVQLGWLSAPPAAPAHGGDPFFPLWPDATAADTAALGYLHANCGHCHNADSDVFQLVPRNFELSVDERSSVTATATYQTAVGQPQTIAVGNATHEVTPGDPSTSALYVRFTSTNPSFHMPPIATEVIDPTGQQILSDWITQLPP